MRPCSACSHVTCLTKWFFAQFTKVCLNGPFLAVNGVANLFSKAQIPTNGRVSSTNGPLFMGGPAPRTTPALHNKRGGDL